MISLLACRRLAPIFGLLSSLAAVAHSSVGSTMTLQVDESQEARRIAFVHEEIRVRPGPLTLAYPRWIPGEHGPTGPIQQVAVIRVHAGNNMLPWTRDPDDIYQIHLDIPATVDRISVDFDTLLENTISGHQILLAWNTVVLYPRGIDKRELMIEPTVILPPKWKQASSLKVVSDANGRVSFAPTSLERLIDSPVLASDFLRIVPLTSSWPAELDITGDSQNALDTADEAHAFAMFGKLIDQDRAMFGFRHWEKMHILVSQSEARPFDGLEHEDSPYNGVSDAGLSKKEELQRLGAWLLTHEQSHSWDGKYRRAAEMYSKPDYQGPERTSLLWVYEGLNQYIGVLLAARAGFEDADYAHDSFAWDAANFAYQPARAFTPLVDTATQDWVLRHVEGGWEPLRRNQDYYQEGSLIWLRADTILREESQDRITLDDFLRTFFGQKDTGPIVVPYTRADVETSLSDLYKYDWHNFFETRIYEPNTKPPTDGLEAAGWRLVYNATPNVFYVSWFPDGCDATRSLGLGVKKDGTIFDVWPGTPAYDAGLGPQMSIVAVDGRAFSATVLNDAIAHPNNGTITLLIKNFDSIETHEVRYAGGLRYAHLERIPGTHDYLTEILQARP